MEGRTLEQTPLRMFVNGQAMSGGLISHNLADATFLGPAVTAPKYRFYSVRDEFPGLLPVKDGGSSVYGEHYEVTNSIRRDQLLPSEPLELELGVIELEDGSGTLCMQLREEWVGHSDLTDITKIGRWREYLSDAGVPRSVT
jgi:gamma-glutamylcyclotransferase (GGCT)/AIG2-like uncharacterized protein YtfP